MTDMSLMALHGILFEQIDRLNDPDLGKEELKSEIARADAMEGIASTIVKNAGVMVKTVSMGNFGKDVNELKTTLVRGHTLPPERSVKSVLGEGGEDAEV